MASAFLATVEAEVGGVPANFAEFVSQPVFVGDDVTAAVSRFGLKIKTGAGLRQQRDRVLTTLAGVLCFERPNVYWVDHGDHRYRPRLGDNVLGVVKASFGEHFVIDVASGGDATLGTLAFDGASKRNRPAPKVGALIYARVSNVHRDMDPELSCMVESGPKKDWMTGLCTFGELKTGTVFKCPLSLAETLLDEKCPVLLALAGHVAYEVAVGVNGFVWVDAAKDTTLTVIGLAIQRSATTPEGDIPAMVEALFKASK